MLHRHSPCYDDMRHGLPSKFPLSFGKTINLPFRELFNSPELYLHYIPVTISKTPNAKMAPAIGTMKEV